MSCIRIHCRTPRRYAVGFKWTIDSHGEHKRIAIRSGSGGCIFVVVVVIKGESEGLWSILEYPLHAVHAGLAFIFSHGEVSDPFLSCQQAHANGVRSGLVATRANGDGIGSGSWKLHGATRFTRSPEQCASLQRLPCILRDGHLLALDHQRYRSACSGFWASARRDCLGEFKVFLQCRGCNAEHCTNIVESCANVIGWERSKFSDINAKQITNGVGIFGAVESARRSALGNNDSICPSNSAAQCLHAQSAFLRIRNVLRIRRRHLAISKPPQCLPKQRTIRRT